MKKVKFGETEFNGYKYDQTKNRLKSWERHYNESEIRFLVKESLRTTRSPARATAYKEWLESHPETEKKEN